MAMHDPRASRTILMVEDDLDFAAVLSLALQLDGHRVQVAPNGAAAIAVLQQRPFDLVITDLSMPRAGGDQLVRHLRGTAGGGPPIVLMTAMSKPDAELLRSVDGFLQKPFTIESLRAMVSALLVRPVAAPG